MLNSIAILGRPNVGKSSLFNKLTKSRNAIVSDFSGLTKDRNFGYTTIKDQKYLIIDTGGVGSEVTEFSAAITEQALIAAEDSNLILLLIDSSEELTADDIDLFQTIRKMNKNFLYPSFDTIAGSGKNGAIVHYRATENNCRNIKR